MRPTRAAKLIGALLTACGALAVTAQTMEAPMRDPWVPPSLRKAAPRPPAEGVELKTQVERKLRASFDAADVGGTGSITREQAQAAGLGFIVQHFDGIDTAGSGRVTFDDLTRYLRSRGAAL